MFDIDFSVWIPRLISVAIIIVLALVLIRIVHGIIKKIRSRRSFDKERETMFRLVSNGIKGLIIALAVILILQICGVNVSGTVAGLGVAGIIVSFALQDFLKDIMSGMSIINEKFFMIGDVVEYNGLTGKVVELNLKTTKIQLLADDSIVSISNRLIDQIRKYPASVPVLIEIPLPYDVSPEQAEITLKKIGPELEKLENVDRVRYDGLYNFADSALVYRFAVFCNPLLRLSVGCAARRCIYDGLLKDGLSVPFNTYTIITEEETAGK